MIPVTLRITLCVAMIIYFVVILYFLKKRMLDLKYTLIWLAAGFVMALMVCFPMLLVWFRGLLGIQSNMNGLFLLAIGFCMLVLMTLTAIVSRASIKIRTLIQEIAMLEKRVRELEKELGENTLKTEKNSEDKL